MLHLIIHRIQNMCAHVLTERWWFHRGRGHINTESLASLVAHTPLCRCGKNVWRLTELIPIQPATHWKSDHVLNSQDSSQIVPCRRCLCGSHRTLFRGWDGSGSCTQTAPTHPTTLQS